MAIPTIDMTIGTGRVLDLRGHRLGELVQALTGCGTEQAELAVGDLAPGATVRDDEALDVLATAVVRIRQRRLLDKRFSRAS